MKVGVDPTDAGMSVMQTLRASLSKLSLSNITPLFSTTRLAINTTLIALIWGLIGLAYVSPWLDGRPRSLTDAIFSLFSMPSLAFT